MHKARKFARLYTRAELNDLCRLVREHQPYLGTAHIGILVTVPDAGVRSALQRVCVEEDWGKAELELEVRMQFGSRRFGGRRRRVADDPALALLQLDEMADTWLRWHAVAADEPQGNGHRKAVLDKLPAAVREQARKVYRAIRRLREEVTNELVRARARRQRTGRQ